MQGPLSRYAIYFTPASSTALARFGASVLGYDPSSGTDVTRIGLKGIAAAELAATTAAPRRYGFHATFVAPFHLGDGSSEAGLIEALTAFCDRTAQASFGLLQIGALGDFIALTAGEAAPVDRLARECVTFFDPFRAPLRPKDLARRDNGRLTQRQRDYLARWGYPYVFEDFRFHMTLAGPLGADQQSRFLTALGGAFRPLAGQACDVDAISLMRQLDPCANFEVIARKALQRTMSEGTRRLHRPSPARA